MQNPKNQPDQHDQAVQIVAQFVALVHGWSKADSAKTAAARNALSQMGVKVTLPRRLQQSKGAAR